MNKTLPTHCLNLVFICYVIHEQNYVTILYKQENVMKKLPGAFQSWEYLDFPIGV